MEEETCKTCKFWFLVGNPDEELNECREDSPKGGGIPQAIARWPLSKATMWCGKYKIKE